MIASELLASYVEHHALARRGSVEPLLDLFGDEAEMWFAGIPIGPFLGRRESGGRIGRLIVTAMPSVPSEDEAYYLVAGDPRGQSGFRGDARRWEALRRPVACALHRSGRFLDIGCANGLLMESVERWARDDGLRVEPWGLDISAALSDLARARCPAFRERIFTGDARTWEPPVRFDAVRTELCYVPEAARSVYLARLATRFLAPKGRLILCSYEKATGAPEPHGPGEWLERTGLVVGGTLESEPDPEGRGVRTRVAWFEA